LQRVDESQCFSQLNFELWRAAAIKKYVLRQTAKITVIQKFPGPPHCLDVKSFFQRKNSCAKIWVTAALAMELTRDVV
jgi:hypothetical protein